mmetsp:Transcript_38361/g.81870  ORF Transcript_38361/g.81870 Transcript_38361/m.81870 type:complete len:85 (-) Transcript_38361:2189-2443(-)
MKKWRRVCPLMLIRGKKNDDGALPRTPTSTSIRPIAKEKSACFHQPTSQRSSIKSDYPREKIVDSELKAGLKKRDLKVCAGRHS